MRLLTFVAHGAHRLGLAVGERIVDLQRAYQAIPEAQREGPGDLPADMLAFLWLGEPAMQAARQVERVVARGAVAPSHAGQRITYAPGEVRIAAPIARPSKIICLGLNYADHIAETGAKRPEVPVLFPKFANAICGPGDRIVLPRASSAVDFEGEMAFVIGKTASRVPLDRAYEYVAGYMNLHDVSARDLQHETSQWLRGKGADTFAPTGPYLVTREDVPDPQTLDVRLWLNGELMQSSNTKHLIFDVPFLVHHISKTMTLEPGDVVSTGTPSGVGFARKPPVLLKQGDVVRMEVGNLGVLENPVVQGD
ncbi:MAG: fumarylacetoacetate hydrolase family protein [Chloroflexi bacterium]|nr:fumarylacetoacetate hydrolase family protein [Chloroflexota bacterium]